MTPTRHSDICDRLADGEVDWLSPLWWLGLPLAVAVALSATAHAAPDFYRRWIVAEHGPLELSQLLIIISACGIALRTLFLPALKGRVLLTAWVGVAAATSFYIAGEEASWGQHFFAWETPPFWAAVNDQGETNLHNLSSWLDQKPRALLEAGVILGGIVIPLAALWRPRLRGLPGAVILPPMLCLPVAVLAEFARFSERILDSFGYQVYPFHRPSEVQEFYFYLFVLLYLTVLYRRLSSGED
jgi:hypothetical protein